MSGDAERWCAAFGRDPASILEAPYDVGFQFSAQELGALHLAGLRLRFEQLRSKVEALSELATEHSIREITSTYDVVPLLFPHTAFKSYPLSWLDGGRFDRLTRWLARFSAETLPEVRRDQLASIDDWIEFIDEHSAVRVVHTFGTSGKLSLIPRTVTEWERGARLLASCLKSPRGRGEGIDLLARRLPIIQPSYRHGASAAARGVDTLVRLFAGGDDNTLFLYPDTRFSADVASLGGRLQGAKVRGESESLPLPPRVLARREEFAARERARPEMMEKFVAEMVGRFAGRDVLLFGVWPLLSEWAEDCLARGTRGVFGPGSVLISGGGTKGRNLPDGWKARIFEFLGFETHLESYVMTEMIPTCPRCEVGNYHVPPVLVPFVLDPVSGAPLTGERVTGRFAFVDLLAETYWGGLVTGDEVTLGGGTAPCACGRLGPYIEPEIRRYGTADGGDDKINCGAAPSAHDGALEYLMDATKLNDKTR